MHDRRSIPGLTHNFYSDSSFSHIESTKPRWWTDIQCKRYGKRLAYGKANHFFFIPQYEDSNYILKDISEKLDAKIVPPVVGFGKKKATSKYSDINTAGQDALTRLSAQQLMKEVSLSYSHMYTQSTYHFKRHTAA